MFALVRRLIAKLTVFIALAFSIGCTPYLEDYVGTWVGIDESGQNVILYEYVLAQADDTHLSLRITRKSYEVDLRSSQIFWREGQPRYFVAEYQEDNDGKVITPFGELNFKIGEGTMTFGKINFVKKARNTELKLKYVARGRMEELYPDYPITD